MERTLFGPGGATEAKQDAIIDLLKSDVRLEIQYSGADPVYLGRAPLGAAYSASVWKVQKFTYSGANLTRIETRLAMKWDDRTTPTPAWD